MNGEITEKLEKRLSKNILIRRLIIASLCVAFIVIGIVFSSLREASKEVTVHGEGIFSYETVTYNNGYGDVTGKFTVECF